MSTKWGLENDILAGKLYRALPPALPFFTYSYAFRRIKDRSTFRNMRW